MGKRVQRSVKIGLLFVIMLAIPYSAGHLFAIYFYGVSPYFAYKQTPKLYQPIVGDSDMTLCYAPRAREVMEGKLIISDVCLPKYKDSIPFMPILNPIIFGTIAKLLDSPGYFTYGLINAKIFTDILFSFLILLIFFFVYKAILEGWLLPAFMLCLSIVKLHFFAGLAQSFAPDHFIYSFYYLLRFINYDVISDTLRWECPILTFIFYGLFFLTGIRAVKKPVFGNLALWASFTGILCYVYLYHFLYAATAFVLITILLASTKEISLRKLLMTYCIFGIVVLLYFYNLLQLIKFENYLDLKQMIGFEQGRFLRWGLWPIYIGICSLVGIVIKLYTKSKEVVEKRLFLMAVGFLATNFIVLNIQVITGFIPHPDHWFSYAIGPAFGIVLAIIMRWFINSLRLKGRRRVLKVARIGCLLLIIWIVSSHYASSFIYARWSAEWSRLSHDYVKSLNVINRNSRAEDTVLSTNQYFNRLLMIYTSTNPFIICGPLTMASHEEVLERFLYGNFIFGVPPDKLSDKLKDKSLNRYLFSNYYTTNEPGMGVINKKTSVNWTEVVPDSEVDRIIQKYENSDYDVTNIVSKGIDVIVETPYDYFKSELLEENIRKYYDQIYATGGWKIWKLKHEYQ